MSSHQPTDRTTRDGPDDENAETVAGLDAEAVSELDAESVADLDAEAIKGLAGQVEVLREENRRLRAERVRARKSEYRRAAIGLGVLGVVAGLAGSVFPESQATLFALAGVGLFTAVLTYYVTPGRVVAASVGERTYAAHAALGEDLVGELGLQDDRVYAPTDAASDATAGVRLFVPQHASYAVPDPDSLASLFVVPDDERARGVAVPPTGGPLVREFERALVDEVADAPAALADQLTEALVEGFELADDAVPELDADRGRLTVGVRGSAFGAVDRFDHPVVSFVAAGLAAGLDAPVRVDGVATDDDRFDYLVTYGWDAGEESGAPEAE